GMGNCELSYTLKDGDGNTLSTKQQYFFISAYMVDGSPSRIYVTGGDTGYIGYVTMKNTDGTDYTGHCGGIAANSNGTTVWVTAENYVYVAKSSDYKDKSGKACNIATEIIEKALRLEDENGNINPTINFTAQFDANCHADFCFYYDDPRYSSLSYDKLYVGEFYRKGNYDTDPEHRLTTPNGYKNNAFMYEYSVNTTSNYGLNVLSDSNLDESNKVPKIDKIFSIPEKVQGMAVAGDNIILSQSYALANSHITVYDKAKVTASASKDTTYEKLLGKPFAYKGVYLTLGGNKLQYYDSTDLKVYYLDYNDENMLKADYSIPSMSEGLCTVATTNNAKVYVLFESAGKKYNTFVREQMKNVYSIRIKA
ncbi:MAG: hypothetical protein K2N22_00120, partial [Clostridia bacterium]|nr:hypothetical protein [Clostridia bacterium]